MSRTTHTSALRPLAGAGLFVAAALAAPPAAHGQTRPEAALLNHLTPTVFVANSFGLRWATGSPVTASGVDGERALLARTPIVQGQDPATAHADLTAVSVSGAYALLGRSSPLDAPRRR